MFDPRDFLAFADATASRPRASLIHGWLNQNAWAAQVLEAYVEEDRSYDEMVTRGLPEEVVQQVIRLVDGSEYKRRQAPPGIKITPRAFGRDRRLPLVNKYRSF